MISSIERGIKSAIKEVNAEKYLYYTQLTEFDTFATDFATFKKSWKYSGWYEKNVNEITKIQEDMRKK